MKKQHKKTAFEIFEKVLWIIFIAVTIFTFIIFLVPFVSAVGITNDGIPHVGEEIITGGGDTYINQTIINGSSYNATYETDINNLLGSTGAFNSTFNQSYHDDIANLLASTAVFNSTFNQSYADGTLWNGTVNAGHITIHPLNLTTSVGIGTTNVNQYYRFLVNDPLYNETYSVINSASNGNSTLLFNEGNVVRYKIFYDAKIALFQIYSFAIDKTIMTFNSKGDVEITRDLKIDNNLTVVGNITTEQIYANNICYNNGSNCNVSLTGYVPYNGATENVNLGFANLTENASINFGSIGALDGEDRRNLMYFLGGDYGNAIADGFRVEYNYNLTLPNDDWLMFIKTDSNDASPDGGIGFGWINGSGYNRSTFLIDGYGNANFTTYNVMTEGNITGDNLYGDNICYSNGTGCPASSSTFNETYDGNLTTIYNLDASTGVFNSTFNQSYDDLWQSTVVFNATGNVSIDNLIASTGTFNSTFNSSYDAKVNRGGDAMTGDLNMTNQISFIGNYLLRWLGVDETTVDAYIYELNGNLDFYLAGGNFTFNNNVDVTGNVSADWFKGKMNYSDLQNVPVTTTVYYYPNTTWTVGGTIADNNITLMAYYDLQTYNITEGNGVNPLDVYINYTNVSNFNSWIIREYYLGSASHHIQFEIYDYPTDTWEQYWEIVGQEGFNVIQIFVYDPTDHISGGIVQTRMTHIQNGISSHKLYIDFSQLENTIDTSSSTLLTGYAKYNFDSNNFAGNGSFWTNNNITADWFKGKINYTDIQNVPAGGSGSTFNATYDGNLTTIYNLDTSTAKFNTTFNATYDARILTWIANETAFGKYWYNHTADIITLYGAWFYNQTTPAITYTNTIAGTADLHTHNTNNLTNVAGLNDKITLNANNITTLSGFTDKILLNGANITAGTINIARLPTLTDTHTLAINNITGTDSSQCTGTDKVSNVTFKNGDLSVLCTTDATSSGGTARAMVAHSETAVTKTNIGVTLINIYATTFTTERTQVINTTGYTNYRIIYSWDYIGGGTQSIEWRKVSDNTKLYGVNKLVDCDPCDTGWTALPVAFQDNEFYIWQWGNSTTAGDDPVAKGYVIWLN